MIVSFAFSDCIFLFLHYTKCFKNNSRPISNFCSQNTQFYTHKLAVLPMQEDFWDNLYSRKFKLMNQISPWINETQSSCKLTIWSTWSYSQRWNMMLPCWGLFLLLVFMAMSNRRYNGALCLMFNSASATEAHIPSLKILQVQKWYDHFSTEFCTSPVIFWNYNEISII